MKVVVAGVVGGGGGDGGGYTYVSRKPAWYLVSNIETIIVSFRNLPIGGGIVVLLRSSGVCETITGALVVVSVIILWNELPAPARRLKDPRWNLELYTLVEPFDWYMVHTQQDHSLQTIRS